MLEPPEARNDHLQKRYFSRSYPGGDTHYAIKRRSQSGAQLCAPDRHAVQHVPCAGFWTAPYIYRTQFQAIRLHDVNPDRTKFVPIAGMIRGSFTHTNNGQPGGAADRFGPNNNATIDEASIFYAGRITSKIGAFAQGTYDGVSNTGALDNTDIRFANSADLAGNRLVYGVSVNNNPTVQDLWNTVPAWGFPWASSPLAPTPAAGLFIESLGSQVVGATVYTMWNDMLYVEGGGYTSLPRNVQQGIGTFDAGQNRIDGGAPYWRVALQNNWQGHYGAIGSFGMRANANPQRIQGAGTDQYTDFGFDATYQYLANPKHILELNATYIREHRDLNASVGLGFAEKRHGSLDVVRVRS